jgi:DNA-binding NarL/FixJ family response regulator
MNALRELPLIHQNLLEANWVLERFERRAPRASITHARSLESALPILAAHRFDAVLLHIESVGEFGVLACRWIIAMGAPVMVLTASITDEVDQAREAGAEILCLEKGSVDGMFRRLHTHARHRAFSPEASVNRL